MTTRSSRAWLAMWSLLGITAAILVANAGIARAQPFPRTWVDGFSGDDTSTTCSRTAPCRTFAAALAVTTAGGEVDVVDPGGFAGGTSTLTITQAVSIVNVGVLAGVQVTSGIDAIVINAGASDIVVLRGLSVDGFGTGLNGIKVTGVGALYVEDCTINNFTQAGVDFEPSGQSRLFVTNTVIRNNRPDPAGKGILFKPALTASGLLDRVHVENNSTGVRVEDRGSVTVRNSSSVGNLHDGFVAVSASDPALVSIKSSSATGNGNGVSSQGAQATVQISDVTVTGNTNGLVASSGGRIVSFNDNSIRGNTTDGLPTSTIPQR